jgi:hypothetical protein
VVFFAKFWTFLGLVWSKKGDLKQREKVARIFSKEPVSSGYLT